MTVPHRLTVAIYWTAIAVFLVAVALLVVADNVPVPELDIPGGIVLVAAWGIAAVGAVLDIARHRRHPQAE